MKIFLFFIVLLNVKGINFYIYLEPYEMRCLGEHLKD